LTEAIRINPKDAVAYQSRARIYRKMYQPGKAEADLAQAKKLGGNDQNLKR
jgi:Tfp pilus assembly protein PilF